MKDMFLVQILMLNLNQFTNFIYHERILRYNPSIQLKHEKGQKSKKVTYKT